MENSINSLIENKDNDKVCVLIDKFTKSVISNISYSSLSKKSTVITDIREINAALQGYKLIIFEPAFLTVITPDIVLEFKRQFNIRFIGIYINDEMACIFQNDVEMIKANYKELDWNLIYGIVQSDNAVLEPYQQITENIDAYSSFKSRIPEDVSEYFERFKNSYLSLYDKYLAQLDLNKELRENISVHSAIGKRSINGIKELKKLVDNLNIKLHSYEALLCESYDVTLQGFYPDRPNIIYIKCISHVAGIDIFLNVLFSVLTTQYRMSCKVVKLVDSDCARVIRYIPNSYIPVTDSYNLSEILENDFVVKLGAFKIALDTLLLNKSNLDFLIIHDMRSSFNDAIDSSLVTLKINEISSDYAILEEYDNILSDLDKKVPFYWSMLECKKYMGTNITKLANHSTIIKVLNNIL